MLNDHETEYHFIDILLIVIKSTELYENYAKFEKFRKQNLCEMKKKSSKNYLAGAHKNMVILKKNI